MEVVAGARRRRVTQQEVARRAGVSQATASYVLSGDSERVGEATRARVLQAARELDYRANPLAQGLRGAPTGLLGVVLRDLRAPAVGELCSELAHAAPDHGFDVLITDAADRTDTFARLVSLMRSRLFDGILLVGELADQRAVLLDATGPDLPCLALLHAGTSLPFPCVRTDDAAGIEQALAHLVGLGHERIAYVGTTWLSGVRAREVAFRDAAAKLGLAVAADDILATAPTREGGGEAAQALLRRAEPPTAVVAATDVLASGVVREATRLGWRIPRDLSVVGFDDIPEAALLQPALTTVHQPYRELAQRALLYFRVAREGHQPRLPSPLHPTLVVRESTSSPRALAFGPFGAAVSATGIADPEPQSGARRATRVAAPTGDRRRKTTPSARATRGRGSTARSPGESGGSPPWRGATTTPTSRPGLREPDVDECGAATGGQHRRDSCPRDAATDETTETRG